MVRNTYWPSRAQKTIDEPILQQRLITYFLKIEANPSKGWLDLKPHAD